MEEEDISLKEQRKWGKEKLFQQLKARQQPF